MNVYMNILIITTCILFQGFFSGSEMILLSSNKVKLRRKSSRGSKGAKVALKMLDDPRWFLATTTTGTNMAVITTSVVSAVWFEHIFGVYGELATILLMSPMLLIFGEIIPRTVCQQNATRFAPQVAPVLFVMSRIILPVTFLVFGISRLFYPRVGKENIDPEAYITREELELVINVSSQGSDVKTKEKQLIRRVFHLTQSTVTEAMLPLINIRAISDSSTVGQAIRLVNLTGFSRIPVYKDRIDNLTGIIYALDLLDISDHNQPLQKFIREVPFVPELKQTGELLIYLQKTRNSIAIVVDEYGGTVGIITIEDILEEVVGEIRDEYDKDTRDMIKFDYNKYRIKGIMEVDDLNDALKIEIPKDNYETVSGFLLKKMGRIPRSGEKYFHENLVFTVTSATKKTIDEIIVEILDDAD